MAKLEAEYGQLQSQEQEAVIAMRARGDKEKAKGKAVQSQQVKCVELWGGRMAADCKGEGDLI